MITPKNYMWQTTKDTLDVILQEPEKLARIKGISRSKAASAE